VSLPVLPPHLIEQNGKKVCSACRQEIHKASQPSLSQAFRTHVIEKHKPKDDFQKKRP